MLEAASNPPAPLPAGPPPPGLSVQAACSENGLTISVPSQGGAGLAAILFGLMALLSGAAQYVMAVRKMARYELPVPQSLIIAGIVLLVIGWWISRFWLILRMDGNCLTILRKGFLFRSRRVLPVDRIEDIRLQRVIRQPARGGGEFESQVLRLQMIDGKQFDYLGSFSIQGIQWIAETLWSSGACGGSGLAYPPKAQKIRDRCSP